MNIIQFSKRCFVVGYGTLQVYKIKHEITVDCCGYAAVKSSPFLQSRYFFRFLYPLVFLLMLPITKVAQPSWTMAAVSDLSSM